MEANFRIRQIAVLYALYSYSEFARRVGLAPETILDYLTNKRVPSVADLTQIQRAFKEINPRWLIDGKGRMIRTESRALTPYDEQLASAQERARDRIRWYNHFEDSSVFERNKNNERFMEARFEHELSILEILESFRKSVLKQYSDSYSEESFDSDDREG